MIDAGTLRRAQLIPTSSWSDAIDAEGIGAVLTGLTWRTGGARVAGRALTVQEEVGDLGAFAQDALGLGAVFRQGSPGDALVMSLGGYEVSTFGGLAGRAATSQGFTMVVIDGACRDIDELRASSIAVVSRYVTPRSGKGRVRIAATNVPVQCGGVTVSPGDLMVSDETGTIVVPKDAVKRVLERAEAIASKDRSFEDALANGETFESAAREFRHM